MRRTRRRPAPLSGRSAARRRRRRRAIRIAALGALALIGCTGIALGVGTTLTGSPGSNRRDHVAFARTRAQRPTPTVSVVGGPPCRAPLTPDAPLRLWIAGDSLAWSVGNGLGRRAAATGVVAPVYESHASSGVANPTFFDWPKRIAEELRRLEPEVVVFVMGTNDWQVPQATPVGPSGEPAWKAPYAASVQELVEALAGAGRTLYWVGPPVLSDPRREAGARAVAEVIRAVVTRHPGAAYVDAHDMLAAPDGSYTARLPIDGRAVQVRTGDGIHLTPEGGDYLGAALLDLIDAQCRVRAQAVAGQRQPLIETQGSSAAAANTTTSAATGAPTASPTTHPSTGTTIPPAPASSTPPSTSSPPTSTGTSPTTGQ